MHEQPFPPTAASSGLAVDVVVPVELHFELPTGDTRPVLLKGERATTLFFNTDEFVSEGLDSFRATATIEFLECRIALFGFPAAEDLPGHALYVQGVSFYGMFEVRRSSWRGRLEAQHQACFPDAAAWNDRHYVITFHGSTFECLADGFHASVRPRRREEVVLDYLMGRDPTETPG